MFCMKLEMVQKFKTTIIGVDKVWSGSYHFFNTKRKKEKEKTYGRFGECRFMRSMLFIITSSVNIMNSCSILLRSGFLVGCHMNYHGTGWTWLESWWSPTRIKVFTIVLACEDGLILWVTCSSIICAQTKNSLLNRNITCNRTSLFYCITCAYYVYTNALYDEIFIRYGIKWDV